MLVAMVAVMAMVRSQAPVMLPTLPRSLASQLSLCCSPHSLVFSVVSLVPPALTALYSVDMCGYVLLLLTMIDTPCLQWPGRVQRVAGVVSGLVLTQPARRAATAPLAPAAAAGLHIAGRNLENT